MASQGIKPVYYFYGADPYLVDEAVERVKQAALSGGLPDLNAHTYDARSARAEDIVATALTMPAFSAMRLVLVRYADAIKRQDEDVFVEYIKRPAPSTCLVFSSYSSKIDRARGIFKDMDASSIKAMMRLDDDGVSEWIRKEARGLGKDITEGAVRRLVSIAGNNLRDVKAELSKIALFALEKKTIETSDIEDAGLDCREETSFGLSDAIGSKDVKKALSVYKKVSGEEPLMLLGAIARQIRILLKIKSEEGRGGRPEEISKAAGVPYRFIGRYMNMARRFGEDELVSAIRAIRRADIDIKTSAIPKNMVMERLILSLCSRQVRPRSTGRI